MKVSHKKFAPPYTAMTLLVLGIFNTSMARADDSELEGWYTGVGVGDATSNLNNERIAEKILNGQATIDALNTDRRDTGYKILAGYQFNNYFSLEGGYFDLGKTGFNAQMTPASTLRSEIKFQGLNFDLVGIMPVDDKFSIFGVAGITYTETKDRLYAGGPIILPFTNRTDKNTDGKLGVGFQYQMSPSWAWRLEAERYRLNDAMGDTGKMNLVSLGLIYRFAQNSEMRHTSVALPAAPAPVPAPVASPPTLAATQEYCSILDIEFEIDKDTIQREEKEKLSVVGTFLMKYPNTTAVIEGHTDNVGSAEDNLQLSRRRADSVMNYLVENFSLNKSRISSVGYGETKPIDDNRSEDGKRHNRRIKAVISCANDIEGLKPLPARVTMALAMEFDHNSANVEAKYQIELAKVGKFLRENTSVTATVEGHTANTSPENATKVSQERAQSVVGYLEKNFGIDPSRLTAEGFGQSRRYAYNSTAEGRQENRRVNIILNYPATKQAGL